MSTFKKNLVADCLTDFQSVGDDQVADDQNRGQSDDVAVTCESIETRINDLLDERIQLSSDHGLQVHANECLDCQQTLRKYEQLELVLGGERQCLGDVGVGRSDVDLRDARQRRNERWRKLSTTVVPTTIVALLALVVFAGPYFSGLGNVGSDANVGTVASVVVAEAESQANLPEMESTAVPVSSPSMLAMIEDMSWTPQASVGQLLVDSGSEWLAGRQEQQAAVIQGLSDVRLDMDLVEARLTALQPVLNYSGRIPALSPMQGTVCFTLGWLRKDKVADEPKTVPSGRHQTGFQSPVVHATKV